MRFPNEGVCAVVFQGDAPEFSEGVFSGIEADAYYPLTNATWNGDVRKNYGGVINWSGGEKISIVEQPETLECSVGGEAVLEIPVEGLPIYWVWQYKAVNADEWIDFPLNKNGAESVSFSVSKEDNGKLIRCIISDAFGNTEISDAAQINVIGSGGTMGDLTGDGKVAMGDVVKLARAVAGNITLTDAEKKLADVTGDGKVAMGDVVKIARFVAGDLKNL